MLRFDVGEFMEACRFASATGGGVQAVADLLGITLSAVYSRRHQLKRKGIAMPKLRRIAARPRAQLCLPAPVTVEYTPLTFTIEVGCGQ